MSPEPRLMRRAVLEAEAVVSGCEDVAVMREPIEQREQRERFCRRISMT